MWKNIVEIRQATDVNINTALALCVLVT